MELPVIGETDGAGQVELESLHISLGSGRITEQSLSIFSVFTSART